MRRHWQYLRYVLKHKWFVLLADWQGAGRALGFPNTVEWYYIHQPDMKLHPETRQWIEDQLKVDDYRDWVVANIEGMSIEEARCQRLEKAAKAGA